MTQNLDRKLHETIWRMREVDAVPWSQISARLGIPEPTLAKIRLAAIRDGAAVKEPNGRVRWLRPEP